MNEQLVIAEIKLGIGKCSAQSKSYGLVLRHGHRGVIMLTINIYVHTYINTTSIHKSNWSFIHKMHTETTDAGCCRV